MDGAKKKRNVRKRSILTGYLTIDLAKKRYGEKMYTKMIATGWLDGCTGIILPTGETALPESDYDRAYKAATGHSINQEEFD